MAYATLAGLAPVYGLYSCFFAAFIYMFFGTSKHVSIGMFEKNFFVITKMPPKKFATNQYNFDTLSFAIKILPQILPQFFATSN